MREEVRRWIEQGRAELAMARSLAESEGSSGAAFHCHQTAEMLLEGLWIQRKRSAAPRFHDLVQLGVELQASEAVRAALYTPEEFERKRSEIGIVAEALREGRELSLPPRGAAG